MSEETEKENLKEENWIKTYWRPAMGWQYFVICMFDFLIAPILNAIYFTIYKSTTFQQWDPLTLKGAGLYHIAMGAIIGVTAWSRGQEKINGYSSPRIDTNRNYENVSQNNYRRREEDPEPKGGPFRE